MVTFKTFVQSYLDGEAQPEDIGLWVKKWKSEDDQGLTVMHYLGLGYPEPYTRWVYDGASLKDILKGIGTPKRKRKKQLLKKKPLKLQRKNRKKHQR